MFNKRPQKDKNLKLIDVFLHLSLYLLNVNDFSNCMWKGKKLKSSYPETLNKKFTLTCLTCLVQNFN